jgi:hypothetical protein
MSNETRQESWRRRCAEWRVAKQPKPAVPCPEYTGPCLRGCDGPLVFFNRCLWRDLACGVANLEEPL